VNSKLRNEETSHDRGVCEECSIRNVPPGAGASSLCVDRATTYGKCRRTNRNRRRKKSIEYYVAKTHEDFAANQARDMGVAQKFHHGWVYRKTPMGTLLTPPANSQEQKHEQ
jgi:hypothetical protein